MTQRTEAVLTQNVSQHIEVMDAHVLREHERLRKNGDEEVAELPGPDRALRNRVPLLKDGDLPMVKPLDGRNELDPGGYDLVPQEPVDLHGVVGVDPVDGHQDVVFDAVFLEEAQAPHDPVKGGPVLLVPAVNIMHMSGTVEADADEEVVFLKEFAPLIVQEGAVGLHGIFEDHGRLFIFFLIFDGLPIEIEPHEGGFAPLPGHRHLGGAVIFDELAIISFQDLVPHPEVAAGIEAVVVQKKTVGTVQVADSAGGLGKDVNTGAGDEIRSCTFLSQHLC